MSGRDVTAWGLPAPPEAGGPVHGVRQVDADPMFIDAQRIIGADLTTFPG
jgi:hypothetical protein